jgi:segregation and condensation protein B
MTEPAEFEAVVEAALFATAEPVSRARLLELFPKNEGKEVVAAIDAVLARYTGEPHQGVKAEEVAGGIRLVTRPELHGYLRRLLDLTGRSRLSMAALETLAIVAYRQPITGPEIQELRSVNSGGVLKTLLERRLVRISGRKMVVGKPFLYATTRDFLMHFGLRNLDELPPLEEFEELMGQLQSSAARDMDDLPFEGEILGPEPVAAMDEVEQEVVETVPSEAVGEEE